MWLLNLYVHIGKKKKHYTDNAHLYDSVALTSPPESGH